MSFELIAFVHNKLNAEMPEVNAEINNIYNILLTHEERIENLEQQNKLSNWVTAIKIKQTFRKDFIRRIGENLTLRTHLLGEGSRLDDFVTEREEIIFDIQQAIEPVKKFFPAEQVDADGFVLELLYNLKQLTLAKEQSDKAEKLFLTGYINEARPLLEETTNEKNISATSLHAGSHLSRMDDGRKKILTAYLSC